MLNKLIPFIGSLLPYIFPKHEFKPDRLIAVIICTCLAILMVHLLGADTAGVAIGLVEELIEQTEE